MAKIQEDIFGNTPKIGDLIVFNPAKYKGLISGVVIDFTKSGLPGIEYPKGVYRGQSSFGNNGEILTPKTGFVIIYDKK